MASSSRHIQDEHMVDVVAEEDIELDEKLSTNDRSTHESDQKPQRQLYECAESFDLENEQFKGQLSSALDMERETLGNLSFKRPGHRFKTELEPEDVRLVNELGQLSADQLMEYLRKIKDMACGLGQAQEDQCLRGKFLGVFK
ncbi:hypothetical protein M3Y97_00134600 [Aphelenchoides bicaudatus]|nr:hypothetical protein M3Y97_00134600 [Aphelenchoides bicaudatus]